MRFDSKALGSLADRLSVQVRFESSREKKLQKESLSAVNKGMQQVGVSSNEI